METAVPCGGLRCMMVREDIGVESSPSTFVHHGWKVDDGGVLVVPNFVEKKICSVKIEK
ncbi:hypothetical protein Hanom_Chr14g01305611 [Helianthus anomalus]